MTKSEQLLGENYKHSHDFCNLHRNVSSNIPETCTIVMNTEMPSDTWKHILDMHALANSILLIIHRYNRMCIPIWLAKASCHVQRSSLLSTKNNPYNICPH
jgi:hypothetical protein